MTKEHCKGCPYYSSYFHGFGIPVMFSYRCWWTLKDPEKITPEEFHKTDKTNAE